MPERRGKGQILNHSAKELFVLETDSGPPIVHRLGPKCKSPASVDADAFKRADGEPILLHSGWWKVPNYCTADIYQFGENILIPVSIMAPVPDKHFGTYKIHPDNEWGEKLTYVTGILKGKYARTIGYKVEKYGDITVDQAIQLANDGKIDNVVVVRTKNGTAYLRTKRNKIIDDNLPT